MISFTYFDAKVFLFHGEAGGKSWNIKNQYYPTLIWDYREPLTLKENIFHFDKVRHPKTKSIDGIFYLNKDEEELNKFFECKIRVHEEEWLTDFLITGAHFYIAESVKIIGLGYVLSVR